MRRLALLFAAFLLIVTACGDDAAGSTTSSTSTTAPPATSVTTTTTAAPTTTKPMGFSVRSDDGRVTLEVPPGALEEDPGLAIFRLVPERYPDDLAALPVEPWVYALEPAGLSFDAPVTLTMEIPFAEYAGEGIEDAIPLTSFVITTPDFQGWELLQDVEVARSGDTVSLTGTTTHFSVTAAVPEQVFIQVRFTELRRDFSHQIGIDFDWSDGVPLAPPAIGGGSFTPAGDASTIPVPFDAGALTVPCPAGLTTTTGELGIDLLLEATSDTTGDAGLTNAPRLLTLDGQAAVTVSTGIELICRPTILPSGTVALDVAVDHPGGEQIVPGEDFRGGLSALYLQLARAFPGLFAGLIQDVDGDGEIGPNDVMFPAQPTTVSGELTEAVLPLFSFGDYFLYLLEAEPPPIESPVTVAEGTTILLGGLSPEQTSVPILGDVPFLHRVFSDESAAHQEVELLVFLTPQLLELTE